MLATPGQSPRHLEPPSPHSSPQPESNGTQKAIVLRRQGAMGPPPPKRPRKQEVLDEDTYVEAIEKIIERDFFPDNSKLQNRLDWLEAVRSGDPDKIRSVQMSIVRQKAERAAAGVTPSLSGVTPGGPLATPASMLGAASPAFSLHSHVTQAGIQSGPAEAEEGPATHLRLDQFLRKYTSEDNASFSDILEKVNRKQAVKSAHLREGERDSQQLLTGPGEGMAEGAQARSAAPTDGFGTSNQPTDRLTLWPYKSANALYYWGADAPPTEGELAERTKGPPKEINRGATRFHGNVFDKSKREETVILYEPVSETPTEDSILKRKVEEIKNAYTQGDRGQGRAYSYVATPSPAPGVDASPFMTWGEIEGTPLRLEAEDTPVGIGGGEGPTFKIPAPPPRDRQAHLLSRKATSNLRARQEIMAGRTPRTPAGGASPAVGGRSAAGQKLVNKAMGKSGKDIDVGLRQSYRASPARSRTPATPSLRSGGGWPSRATPVSTRALSESPYTSKTGERNQTGDTNG